MLRRMLFVVTLVVCLSLCLLPALVDSQKAESGHGRRLAVENVEDSPFMNGICMDMIQDSTLQISVTTFSVIIVARNEDKDSVLKTVCKVCDLCRDDSRLHCSTTY